MLNSTHKLLGTLANSIKDKEKESDGGQYYSVYRGVVENVADPLLLGRVQVRVPSVHGINYGSKGEVSETNRFIPTYDLPFAYVISSGGGGSSDMGTSIPLTVGALVLVVFEGGSIYTPIVIGTLHCFPSSSYPVNTDPWHELPNYRNVPMSVTYSNRIEPTSPTEACLSYRQSQTRFVLHKSLKGHTIWGEDRDDSECFEIIDRNGQGFRMEGAISVEDNKDNEFRRKTKSVFSKSGIPKPNVSRVLIKELGNNSIILESFEGERKLRIGSGKTRIELDGIRQRVIIGDQTGSQIIEIDNETNTVRIKSPTLIIDSNNIKIKGDTVFYKKVEVLGNLQSYKRLITNEVNDSLPRAVMAGI